MLPVASTLVACGEEAMMRRLSRVCACVLAAGGSRRMGECKLLMPFAGSTLLERALEAAAGCAAEGVVAVTGAYADEMAPVVRRMGAREVRNQSWARGQASSVRAAVLHAACEGFDAVMLMVADQPFVTRSHLDALLRGRDGERAWACLSAAGGRSGNPCLFDKRCFPALLELQGDEGARSLFRRHSGIPVRCVHFEDARLFEDVDTPEDLARLEGAVAHAR